MEAMMDGVVLPSVWHRTIDGNRLCEARIAAGFSQADFAERAGHSQQFQQRIEAPGQHEVLLSRAEAVIAVLQWGKGR